MKTAWAQIAVATTLALGACAAPQPPAVQQEAIAPKASDEDVRTRLAQAHADLAEGRIEAARKGFDTVLKARPANVSARAGLAETYLAEGDGERALVVYAALPSAEAEQPAALQGRGIAHLLTGDDSGAEPLLAKAVAADPTLWRAWNGLGLIHDGQGRWGEADRAYRMAAEAAPSAAAIHNNWGYSLLQRGEDAQAINHLRKALELSPTLEAAKGNLTLARALTGNYEAALAASPADGLPVALNNVGFAALLRGDYAAAEDFLSRALQSSPRHFPSARENLRWLNYLKAAAQPEQNAAWVVPEPAPAAGPTRLTPPELKH